MQKRFKILLADDETDVLEFLSYNLWKADFEVIKSTDGWEAVNLAKRHSPDLIIMDIHMPSLSGIDACRIIRSQKELLTTPILFLTGDGDEYISMSAINAGGSHYITKPVKLPFLMKMIREIVTVNSNLTLSV
jgi:two-component system alkaline phosphatase synthesis response regulator PhoP